ncbi:hypothetical protein A3I25_01410 [Candidatus Nomurabacteria bacterium RIFCSPLOWO2_02_FULL_42_17]|uniref:Small-conductance mechanosensitive ion channel n=1 Tax=Candidatus Nomurabacteria bacterium RIFCSPLOWO2_02_FULL_42_17 TaxID=1801789 RepID=A0A1F6XS15_9BACT|nr:MAG: Small-conductance mechanosensitive ion channel-like protein [Microgenomates group bacterium GW2011_GWA2_46_16]OGI96798.1 MAG: hypothetical protein A3I25_01410 [Candidatus Nomurabacteria bacterium RIFCSPLOWO2_02_FULL_42_17]
MDLQSWGGIFTTSLQDFWGGFISFVPNFIFAILVFIVGWLIGSLIGKTVGQLISALKVDKLFQSAGADQMLSRAGLRLDVGGFIGWLVKWFIIIVFLMTSLDMLNLTQVSTFLREDVLGYIPQVAIAALVLVIGGLIAEIFSKFMASTVKAASMETANMVGTISRYAVWIFTVIIALDQLGVAQGYMQTLFTGVIAMLALAGGLAFGLGGKESASRWLDKVRSEMMHH